MKSLLFLICFFTTSLEAISFSNQTTFDTFKKVGPYSYEVEENFSIRVSRDEVVSTDVFLVKSNEKRPLLIFQHGNKAHKGVHKEQAKRAASWGFNVLTVEQPNVKRWITNGKVLGSLTKLIYSWPQLLNNNFDRENIVLVGHSFGGSAASIAAGSGAPVKGIILLDPALVSKKVIPFLRKIKSDVVLLGADRKVFKSRRRNKFYRNIKKNMIEVSIKDSTHNDAQYPNLFSLKQTLGLEHATNIKRQNTFTSAIITAAFSMTKGNSLSFFYKEMKKKRREGTLSFMRNK